MNRIVCAISITTFSLLFFLIALEACILIPLFKFAKQEMVTPVILNIKGVELSKMEKIIFKKSNPFGFVLHGHNFRDKKQIVDLIKSTRDLYPNRKIYFFVDQEGGWVDRLSMIGYSKAPAALDFGNIAQNNLTKAKELLYDDADTTSSRLREVGIDVNLGPILDILYTKEGEMSSIGSRSYNSNIDIITKLGESFIEASIKNNIYVTLKHIPGLGNSFVDTHDEPVIIDTKLNILKNTDFVPFRRLSKYAKFAMVSHIVYADIDDKPASISKKTISVIREDIGFNGLLISDAFSMKAISSLDYTPWEISNLSLNSGVDIIIPNDTSLDITTKVIEAIDKSVMVKFNKKLKKLNLLH
jgi:beta-N-acetylhexosaminidase